MRYVQMPQTSLELTESSERLQILENGYKMRVVETKHRYLGLSVDTPEDLERIREYIKHGGERTR
jgi:3-deoxy-manno-octulosonate cytidylyltransferase (CMP-KDO synthetase)